MVANHPPVLISTILITYFRYSYIRPVSSQMPGELEKSCLKPKIATKLVQKRNLARICGGYVSWLIMRCAYAHAIPTWLSPSCSVVHLRPR